MEKVLNQEEIDALFRATQKGEISGASARVVQKAVSNFNLREISQINKDQVRALSTLRESFARHVSNSLGAKDVRVARSFCSLLGNAEPVGCRRAKRFHAETIPVESHSW